MDPPTSGIVLKFKKNKTLGAGSAIAAALADMQSQMESTPRVGGGAGYEEEMGGSSSTVCPPKRSDLFDVSARASTMSGDEWKQHINLSKQEISSLPDLFAQYVSVYTISAAEIKRLAVVEVNQPYTSGNQSVNDPRMGATEFDQVCPTCRMNSMSCTGHFGYVRLNEPIINPLAIRDVIRVLRSVCNDDGRPLIPKETLRRLGILNLSGARRLEAIEDLVMKSGYACIPEEGCTQVCKTNPFFDTTKSEEKNLICYTLNKKQSKEYQQIYSYTMKNLIMILTMITPETYELLGFENGSSAANYIFSNFPVLPNTVRLPTDQDGTIWDDELTRGYVNLVKLNNQLANKTLKEDERTKIVNEMIEQVKAIFIKNEKANGKDKSIRSKLQGKEALFRSNLMGKRVDFSARTVISPDPSLKFGQVRVPLHIARISTKPVLVADYNRKALTRLLRQGRVTHIVPGPNTTMAHSMIGLDIQVKEKERKNYVPQIGDKLRRWLQNGDFVVINRQPTLSKMSLMGMEVVIVNERYQKKVNQVIYPGDDKSRQELEWTLYEGPKTFGLHLAYTTPYNADFDGDEMNMHVPQTPEAEAELRAQMSVGACLISGQTNMNAMGVVYNPVTGGHILTEDGMTVDPNIVYDAITLLTSSDFNFLDWQERVLASRIPLFSGKAFFSLTLPPDFFYNKEGLVIKNGVMIKGTINKDHIGPSGGSVVQDLWHQYGPQRAGQFITDTNYIIDYWFSRYGFSVGMKDCNPKNPEQNLAIRKEIEKAKLVIQSYTNAPVDDPIELERRERQIIQEIDSVTNTGKVLMKDKIPKSNALSQMVRAKTKGKESNYIQITGFIGQQFLAGKRLDKGLAYFDPDDPEFDLESQGFIKSSFISGMNPAEMFFHQATGREGIINTGLTTAVTGEIQRKIIKSTEDITVWRDGTVRNTFGTIFQFVYGGDGYDPERLMKIKVHGRQKLWIMNIDSEVAKLNAKYGY